MKDQPKEREFLELVRKHQNILHKIRFVYCKSAADREDLYQEMILQLWKSFASFQGESSFSTWMYRVALNTALTASRRKNLPVETSEAADPAAHDPADVELSEEVRLLHQAISRLQGVERAIILLWLEEKSYEEIGDIIGITAKNVSVRLVRIRARLAALLEKLR